MSGYADEGANRWAAGHTLDVAALFRLALDKAPAGSQLIAAAEEGIAVRPTSTKATTSPPADGVLTWAPDLVRYGLRRARERADDCGIRRDR